MADSEMGASHAGMNDKEKMKYLFYTQVEGTEDLYLDIGYFMRMRFWETINKKELVFKIMSASEASEYEGIYDNLMGLMNRYIENPNEKTSIENVNNMVFNRNMVKKNFADDQEGFVKNLRTCLLKEKEILVNHCGISFLPEVVLWNDALNHQPENLEEDEMNEDLSPMAADRDKFCEPGLSFDTKFLDMIENEYNKLEQNWKYSCELRQDLDQKSKKLDACESNLKYVLDQEIEDILKRIEKPQKDYEDTKRKLLEKLEQGVKYLWAIKAKYLHNQALMEVNLRPRYELISSLTIVFDRFAKILKKMYQLEILHSGLEKIMKSFLNLTLCVVKHPKCFIFVHNNDKKGKGKNSPDNNDTKDVGKASKGYHTKKKSSISSNILILGYDYLSCFHIKDTSITLKNADNMPCGELSVPDYETVRDLELSFSDIKVLSYKRQGNANIRSQFVRLFFSFKVRCFEQDFEITTESLPFYLCTGALQELELIGTLMWHCGSNNSMYVDCHLHDELSTDQVFSILDQRMKSMSIDKQRGLSYIGWQFLLNQIPCVQGQHSGQRRTISLHSFAKQKISKTEDTSKDFSFFTWFYAFVNTIETYLLEPWLDGIIYDLMTQEEADQVLFGDSVPPNTALIRPARSFVVKPNCMKAEVKLAVAIKIRLGDEDNVVPVILDMDRIRENGLYHALLHIEYQKDESVIKFVWTPQGKVPLENLKVYTNNQAKQSKQDYHGCFVTQVNKLKLQEPDGTSSSSIPPAKTCKLSENDFTCRKRKSSRQTSLSSSSAASPQAASHIASPYSASSTMNSELSPNGYKNEARSPGIVSHGTALEFSPQQDMDLSEVAVNVSQTPCSPSREAEERKMNWTKYGNQKVDVSKIAEAKASLSTQNLAMHNAIQNGCVNNNRLLNYPDNRVELFPVAVSDIGAEQAVGNPILYSRASNDDSLSENLICQVKVPANTIGVDNRFDNTVFLPDTGVDSAGNLIQENFNNFSDDLDSFFGIVMID